MTEQELNAMVPRKTIVTKIYDRGVSYMYMGKDDDGKYLLCGMPYSYEGYLIKSCYNIKV